MVEVTQADRDAYARMLREMYPDASFDGTDQQIGERMAIERVVTGQANDDPWVQAFAHHAEQARLEERERLTAERDARYEVAISAGNLVVAADGMEELRPSREMLLSRLEVFTAIRKGEAA